MVLPSSIPGRVATVFLLISLMFIYVSYSANIVALIQSSSSNIQTLEDLLNSRITLGVDDTVYSRFYFPNAKDPIRKAIYEKKIASQGKTGGFLEFNEGLKKLRAGIFAFHMELGPGYKAIGEQFTEDERCGLQEIDFLNTIDPWYAIQKNSSYKELLKIGLRLIRESGIQQRENNLIYTKKPRCSLKNVFLSVSLVDCYPLILLLIGGIITSFFVFFSELYFNYKSATTNMNHVIFIKEAQN
ncbi:glutamate receptor 1-like isoform X2 [Anthonomus grandis grandis]|nr:glutamate receptor 1-like isoform X2 [Anthonomus grandis grandis]